MELYDFQENERITRRVYHGNAGTKRAYLHDDIVWMVKFPQNTRNFVGNHLPSYTSSPLSEYIGSHIYDSLGIPVHETVLGRCQGKIVVGCRDFTVDAELLDFHGIKNTVDEAVISGSIGSSAHGERLSDVLKVIDNAEDFSGIRDKVKERFWDMFVTDAFIRNNDRNNGNWGLLVTRYTTKLAPVFDNGNAFFSKRNFSVTERRLNEAEAVENDIQSGMSFFTDNNDKHIHPFQFIAAMENADCNAAIMRFVERLDMNKVEQIIEEIPEKAFSLDVILPVQKEYYKKLLYTAYKQEILPVAEKLKDQERSSFMGLDQRAEKSRAVHFGKETSTPSKPKTNDLDR